MKTLLLPIPIAEATETLAWLVDFFFFTNFSGVNRQSAAEAGYYGGSAPVFNAGGTLLKGAAVKGVDNVKYIGRLEDLKGIPRSQTLLDDLPNLGNPKANYYQNMSVLRKAVRDGYTIKDASWFRPNSELAPTLLNPNRTVGQTFLGAERLLLKNRGLWP